MAGSCLKQYKIKVNNGLAVRRSCGVINFENNKTRDERIIYLIKA